MRVYKSQKRVEKIPQKLRIKRKKTLLTAVTAVEKNTKETETEETMTPKSGVNVSSFEIKMEAEVGDQSALERNRMKVEEEQITNVGKKEQQLKNLFLMNQTQYPSDSSLLLGETYRSIPSFGSGCIGQATDQGSLVSSELMQAALRTALLSNQNALLLRQGLLLEEPMGSLLNGNSMMLSGLSFYNPLMMQNQASNLMGFGSNYLPINRLL